MNGARGKKKLVAYSHRYRIWIIFFFFFQVVDKRHAREFKFEKETIVVRLLAPFDWLHERRIILIRNTGSRTALCVAHWIIFIHTCLSFLLQLTQSSLSARKMKLQSPQSPGGGNGKIEKNYELQRVNNSVEDPTPKAARSVESPNFRVHLISCP
jgi:hypothetical protein